jgi:hypothetical protein
MFDLWISQARDHWKEHQPTRFRELKKVGKLGQALKEAAELTHREMSQLEAQGFKNHEAWEMVREKYLFPPQESGVEQDEPNPWAELRRDVNRLQNEIAREYDESQDR